MNMNNLREERGQSIVIVAIAMIVLLIFVVIAVDMAYAYVHRRGDQNAADASALAGARELADILNANDGNLQGKFISEQTIQEAMNDYAEQNGIADTDGTPANSVNTNVTGYYLDPDGSRLSDGSSDIEIGELGIVHPNARGVEAVAHSIAPSFFGGVLGLSGLPIQAEAAVVFEPGPCTAGCLAPIATLTETFQFDECYNIWDGPHGGGGGEGGSGNFGWLNWSWQGAGHSCEDIGLPDDCSVNCLEYNLGKDTCLSGLIDVGDWVAGTTGVKNANSIRDELRWYIDTNTPFIVIIYDTIQGTGCGKKGHGTAYHVVGFAEFQPVGYRLSHGGGAGIIYDTIDPDTCVDWGSEGNRITGVFKRWVTDGLGGECNDFGVLVPRMTK